MNTPTATLPVSVRLGEFLAWLQCRRGATAAPDDMDVAEALLRLAGDDPVAERHVEQLLTRFRRCALGPRRIVAASELADELRAWQAGRPVAATDELVSFLDGDFTPLDPPVEPTRPVADADFELDLEPGDPTRGVAVRVYQPGIASQPPPAPVVAPDTCRSAPPVWLPLPPSASAAPAAPQSGSLVDALPSWLSDRLPGGGARLLAGAIGALGLTLLVAVLLSSSCLSEAAVEVTGAQRLEHVGVALDLPEPWMHARDYDQEAEKDGWVKRWSVLYRGIGPSEFEAQLVVMTLRPSDGTAATDLDARTSGASETVGLAAFARECSAFEEATLCRSLYVRGTQRFSLYEIFYVLDGTVVFVKAAYPARDVAAELRGRQSDMRMPPEWDEGDAFHLAVHAEEVKAIVSSITVLAR